MSNPASQDSKTRPYKADFSADSIPQMGASLLAFNVQAKYRGYRLIGCVTAGFNALFLRNDIAPAAFPAYDPAGCFSHVQGAYEQELKRRRSEAEKIEWVNVDEALMNKLKVAPLLPPPPPRTAGDVRRCFGSQNRIGSPLCCHLCAYLLLLRARRACRPHDDATLRLPLQPGEYTRYETMRV